MRGWLKRIGGRKGALPDFVIIGAQKCGTTYVYHNLLRHPSVQGALENEVHFFNTPKHRGGKAAYRECFPPREDGNVVGEKSPNYLYFPGTAERMHGVVPNAKLIVLLRNPVDRAYSHYQQARRMGRETLSFEEALEREPERIDVAPEAVAFRAFSYAAKGAYADQLAEWFRFFPREWALILKSEDMYENPREAFGSVQEFVGVPERDLELGKRYRLKGGYQEPMKPETRERLEAHFEPHNKKLYEYLGRDFGW